MTAPDLPAFLLARADDREREAPDIHRADCGAFLNDALGGGYVRSGCDCGEPARVLAECAAKRAVVEHCAALQTPGLEPDYDDGARDTAYEVMVRLAQPYASHPDFNPAWRV